MELLYVNNINIYVLNFFLAQTNSFYLLTTSYAQQQISHQNKLPFYLSIARHSQVNNDRFLIKVKQILCSYATSKKYSKISVVNMPRQFSAMLTTEKIFTSSNQSMSPKQNGAPLDYDLLKNTTLKNKTSHKAIKLFFT